MKSRTSISLDSNILTEAQDRQLNISGLCERALKERIHGTKEVEIKDADKCDFCGKKEEKATRDNLIGLIWLWPDERWICDSCLNGHSRKNLIGIASKRG